MYSCSKGCREGTFIKQEVVLQEWAIYKDGGYLYCLNSYPVDKDVESVICSQCRAIAILEED